MESIHKIRRAFIYLSILIAISFIIIISITEMDSPRLRSTLLKISTKKIADYKYCYNASSNAIILFHLTNRSNEWKRLEVCAFKRAAALTGIGVCVLTTIEMKPHRSLIGLTNLQFAPLDIERILIGTTVHDWYLNIYSNESAVGEFAMYELSDGLRWAYLYKFGGYYLDTDTITLKNFTRLRNTTAYQGINDEVAMGILFFDKGHPLIKACLDMIPTSYNPNLWGTFGPRLLTNVIRRGNVSSDTYRVLGKELYPTTYWEYNLPFSKSSKDTMKILVKNSYTLHLWRKLFDMQRHPVDYWKDGVVFPEGSFIQEICGDV